LGQRRVIQLQGREKLLPNVRIAFDGHPANHHFGGRHRKDLLLDEPRHRDGRFLALGDLLVCKPADDRIQRAELRQHLRDEGFGQGARATFGPSMQRR